MMVAYYNEIDKYAAAWLRNLISAGLIAPGDVDERDIKDVKPGDLRGYTQCHFFAGIGGWSAALRMAGWPDDRPVWTGSCPCQPFSTAGKQRGEQDPRHLWPTWFELIRQRSPAIIFGEQVASKSALEWIDIVSTDLENEGYAFGAADLCAAGVSAPHIRQRLWFVGQHIHDVIDIGQEVSSGGMVGGMAYSDPIRCEEGSRLQCESERRRGAGASDCRASCRLGDTFGQPRPRKTGSLSRWGDVDWLGCGDGKWRPIRSGAFPLAHGVSNRGAKLRAIGNAIVPQVAAAFVEAYCAGEVAP